ncbi:MAG TPA: P-II family nitrogen regulator [Syntrophorhabdales bacterium]|nr:P-II family nitrogen regulator [Syntrophorhabdales bacterium]
MVKIEAVIKPEKQEEVKQALVDIGVQGMTVFEVRGFGRQKGQHETYRGTEIKVSFVHKVMVTIVIKDELLDTAIEAIRKAAHTDTIGDGKIFVTSVQRVVRIRTGETGPQAL